MCRNGLGLEGPSAAVALHSLPIFSLSGHCKAEQLLARVAEVSARMVKNPFERLYSGGCEITSEHGKRMRRKMQK